MYRHGHVMSVYVPAHTLRWSGGLCGFAREERGGAESVRKRESGKEREKKGGKLEKRCGRSSAVGGHFSPPPSLPFPLVPSSSYSNRLPKMGGPVKDHVICVCSHDHENPHLSGMCVFGLCSCVFCIFNTSHVRFFKSKLFFIYDVPAPT